ncbi:hypothetical protein KAJ89_03420 [Candidatus Parcubacteria bacterium]|nr:hypothetical protein [Candidatus Parcubacteria bacterium]
MYENEILDELKYIRNCEGHKTKKEMILSYQELVKKPDEQTMKKLLDFVYDTDMSDEEIVKKIDMNETKMIDPVGESLKKIKKDNIKLEKTINSTKKGSLPLKQDWQWLLFLIIIFFAIVLPILMFVFDFGPTEKGKTIEDTKQHEYDAKLWSR